MSDSESFVYEMIDFRSKVRQYLSDRINGEVFVDLVPRTWFAGISGSVEIKFAEFIHVIVIIDGIKYEWARHGLYSLIRAGITPEEVGGMCLSSIRDLVIANTLNKTFKDSDGIWKPQWSY